MPKEIIVFDFDKTLTYNDTLLGFFLNASEKNLCFPLKVFFYFILMFCAKFNLISNQKLKETGVYLFLKNKTSNKMLKDSRSYVKNIKFNNLFNEFNFTNYDQNIYVVTASFKEYIEPIFPSNIKVIGSQIEYSKGKIKGLNFNCYKQNKIKALKSLGIKEIDVFYTDSYSDFPLAEISKKIIIVKKDMLYECSDLTDFISFFRKSKNN
ncbi:MAG: HAD family hydrolase [Bacteroidota bacterium]